MSAARLPLREATPLRSLDVPGVWRADALGAGQSQVQPTGYPLLDAQLPGGGWPVGALSEVLQPVAGLHEWQLLLPALVQATAQRPGTLVVVAPPCEPFAPALMAHGLPAQRMCLVRSTAAAALWAAEQALRCRDVVAVMAWLPQAQPAALRRLQLAAAQQQQLLWVFRPLAAAPQASPALLRLQVQGQGQEQGHGQHNDLGSPIPAFSDMQVHILKRRGPPLVQGLQLPGCPQRLAHMLAAQAQRRSVAHSELQGALQTVASVPPASGNHLPGTVRDPAFAPSAVPTGVSAGVVPLRMAMPAATVARPGEEKHALDRVAIAAMGN